MKEQNFIDIIKKQIGTEYIGDDCAYLKELGIVVSQDSLVEDVHFKRTWCSPWQLGYKAVTVNISDILAAGAQPAYITIALSLPQDISNGFVEEFYSGAKSALRGAKIIGGDITGADKVYISITAIGLAKNHKISSRKNAKIGYKIIVKSEFGKSAAGLKELITGGRNNDLIRAHLEPELDENFALSISNQIDTEYAMMDTSDGLADALFKIAEASKLSIDALLVDGMFGAEDYKIVAAVPEKFLEKISGYHIIGEVNKKADYVLKIGNKKFYNYDELGLFDHFGEN